jgi:hypothetical protein
MYPSATAGAVVWSQSNSVVVTAIVDGASWSASYDGGRATSVIADNQYFFWTEPRFGRLWRQVGAPPAPPPELFSPTTAWQPFGLAAFNGVLYVTDASLDGGVWSCPEQSSCSAGSLLAAHQSAPQKIVFDAISNALYWVNHGDDAVARSGSIMRCRLPQCPQSLATIADAQDHPVGLAVDDRYVFWGTTSGSIMRLAK